MPNKSLDIEKEIAGPNGSAISCMTAILVQCSLQPQASIEHGTNAQDKPLPKCNMQFLIGFLAGLVLGMIRFLF